MSPFGQGNNLNVQSYKKSELYHIMRDKKRKMYQISREVNAKKIPINGCQ